MPNLVEALTVAALLAVALYYWSQRRALARAEYIRRYRFPPGLFERLARRRPQLDTKDQQLIARGLRQFFLAYLTSGRKFVSMPSQVADDLWHEFILYTRHYQDFCRKAFGRMLHHTPAAVLGRERLSNAGLRRCWWYCCREENINPRNPTRLPLLFALDAKLGVADGFHYAPDCTKLRQGGGSSGVHCGGDFGSTAFDGGTDGMGDSGSDGGGGGGDSSCGGGCGGD